MFQLEGKQCRCVRLQQRGRSAERCGTSQGLSGCMSTEPRLHRLELALGLAVESWCSCLGLSTCHGLSLACRKRPACTGTALALTLVFTVTGIQYSAQAKNCDLIVQSCDFHSTFKADWEWLAESRTCFATKGVRDTFTHHFIALF